MVDPSGIELIAPLSSGGFIAKTLQSKGPGLITISLKVADLDEAMKELESQVTPTKQLKEMVASGRLGKKTGSGFYDY